MYGITVSKYDNGNMWCHIFIDLNIKQISSHSKLGSETKFNVGALYWSWWGLSVLLNHIYEGLENPSLQAKAV